MIYRLCGAALSRSALVSLFAVWGAVACSDAPGDPATGGTSAGVGGSSLIGGSAGTAPSAGHSNSVGGAAVGGSGPAAGGTAGSGGAQTSGATSGGATSGGGGGTATGGSLGLGGDGAVGGATGGTASSGGGGTSAGAGAGGEEAGGRAAGGAGAGSGGAGSGYQVCPSSPCKVMPFGDSITFGVGDEANAGYRGPLFAKIVGAGQKVTFTGSLSNGPSMVANQPFPQKNEGHSGWGISRVTPYSGNNAGITTVIPNPGFSSGSGGVPDIILLHIGTNDASTLSASQMSGDLAGLLDKLILNAPNAYIVVAQIIPLGYGDNAVIKAYNQSIPELVQARASAGKHVALVDMFTGFTQNMFASDNVHPNRTGYALMAERWYSAISAFLPE